MLVPGASASGGYRWIPGAEGYHPPTSGRHFQLSTVLSENSRTGERAALASVSSSAVPPFTTAALIIHVVGCRGNAPGQREPHNCTELCVLFPRVSDARSRPTGPDQVPQPPPHPPRGHVFQTSQLLNEQNRRREEEAVAQAAAPGQRRQQLCQSRRSTPTPTPHPTPSQAAFCSSVIFCKSLP